MILKKIKLHNYRQHKNKEITFNGNLISVIGRNGAGKSNFLGAIQYALSGEQPGFNKKDLTTWGESEGSVILEFEHNGTVHKISRHTNSPGVSLTYGTNTINGSRKVDEEMNTIMGVDRDLFRQVVFVRQAEVDSILFTDPKSREVAFQKLLGLGEANKINKQLGEIISGLDVPENFDDAIESAKKSLSEAKVKYEALEERYSALEEEMNTLPDSKEEQARLKSIMEEKVKLQCMIENMDKAFSLDNEISEARKEYDSEFGSGYEKEDVCELETKLDTLKSSKASLENAAAMELKLKELDENVPSCSYVQADVDSLKNELDTASAELSILKTSILEKKSLLEKADDGLVCPMCGSVTEHGVKEHLKKEIESISAQIEEKNSIVSNASYKYHDANSKYSEYSRLRMLWNARHDQYVQARDSALEKVDPSIDATNLDADIAIITAKVISVKEKNEKFDSLTIKINSLETARKSIVPPDMTKESILEKLAKLDADQSKSNSILDEIRTIESMMSEYRGTMNGLNISIDSTLSSINDLIEKKANTVEKNRKLAVLRKVRDWFHYSNGPHVMTSSVLNDITYGVNKFLDQFSAPFTVVADEENFGFKCRFNDGRAMPNDLPDASMLSGGQKIQLAIAFRMATYCVFASKLGLLVLDEPTAYLDDSNIGRFGDLLQKIKVIAKNMNLQVLIATHEKGVEAVCDSSIDLN